MAVHPPYCVSEYHFVDDKVEAVSFHTLPIQWSDNERQEGRKPKIFLHGTANNGGQDIFEHVIAWKFNLFNEEPEIMVLANDNNWIKLGRPRKTFEDIIRSIMITVHCLHYVKRNPEQNGESVWNHLSQVLGLYVVSPSQNDLLIHMSLIRDSMNRYPGLADSKFLASLFKEKMQKRKFSDEDIPVTKLRVTMDDKEHRLIDDVEDEGNDYLFGEVCALCDDGGNIICCEGGCLRSFHATEEAGAGSHCKSLGLMEDDVVGMRNFYCKNCEHKQHQCFACGKLGSSDKSSGIAEVVSCASAICGRFYHPHCAAVLLYEDSVPAEELEKKIAGGERFTCPIHKCCICKQEENMKDSQLQFAVCLRCPKSYHRKCLPREIKEETHLEGRSIPRSWDDLLPNRTLIYCTKHEIDVEIGTVRRDHIEFPDVKQKASTLKKEKIILEEKWKMISELLVDKVVSNETKVSFEKLYREEKVPTALTEQKPSSIQTKKTRKLMSESPLPNKKNPSVEESCRKRNVSTTTRKQLKPSSTEEKQTSHVQKKRKRASEPIVNGDEVVPKGSPLEELFRVTASTVSKLKQKSASAMKASINKNRGNVFSRIDISRNVKRNCFLKEGKVSMSKEIKTPLHTNPLSSLESQKVKLQNPGKLDNEMHKRIPPDIESGNTGYQHPDPCKRCATSYGGTQVDIPDEAIIRCITSNIGPPSSVTNPGSGKKKNDGSGKPYSIGMENKVRAEFGIVTQAVCMNREQDQINSRGKDSEFDFRTFSSTFYRRIGHVADSLCINGLAMTSDATKIDDTRATLPGYLDWSMGFARGPHLNYSLQNSAGWLDE